MKLPRSFLAVLVGSTGLAVSTPTAVAALPDQADGCLVGATQTAGTSAKRTVTSGGIERTYILHLPKGYDTRRAWPVVLAYHGRGSTGTEMEGFSGLSRLPAIVAYPNGVVGTGEGHRQAWQGAPYSAPGVDDVAFTRDLLDDIGGSFCADPRRTFATGKSNGGGFANLLACQLPDRVAAVAPVAAALYPGARVGCATSHPVPTLMIHGTDDATIPYAGDADRDLPAITDWTEQLATKASCANPPRTTTQTRDAVRTSYRDCADQADVEQIAVRGGGHTWPGADAYSGGGYTSQLIEASEAAWKFFQGRTTTAVGSGS